MAETTRVFAPLRAAPAAQSGWPPTDWSRWIDALATEHHSRIWDRVGEELVERESALVSALSRYVPGHWIVAEKPGLGACLRLSRDSGGRDLYLTEAEANARRVEELEALLRQR